MWTDIFLAIGLIANSVSIIVIVRWLKFIDKPIHFSVDDLRRSSEIHSFYEKANDISLGKNS